MHLKHAQQIHVRCLQRKHQQLNILRLNNSFLFTVIQENLNFFSGTVISVSMELSFVDAV